LPPIGHRPVGDGTGQGSAGGEASS
jgi:hypothetical protein